MNFDGILLLFIVILSITKSTINKTSYSYDIIYAVYVSRRKPLDFEHVVRLLMCYALLVLIFELQNDTQTSTEGEIGHICRLTNEEKLDICKEALQEPICLEHEIKLMEKLPVLRTQLYEIKRSGFKYAGLPPIKIEACICPTNPPLYLQDNSTGNHVNVYVTLRDKYSDVVGAFVDEY